MATYAYFAGRLDVRFITSACALTLVGQAKVRMAHYGNSRTWLVFASSAMKISMEQGGTRSATKRSGYSLSGTGMIMIVPLGTNTLERR